jgi:hypothetical protein
MGDADALAAAQQALAEVQAAADAAAQAVAQQQLPISLPEDQIQRIVNLLDDRSLGLVARVCNRWPSTEAINRAWHRQVVQEFPVRGGYDWSKYPGEASWAHSLKRWRAHSHEVELFGPPLLYLAQPSHTTELELIVCNVDHELGDQLDDPEWEMWQGECGPRKVWCFSNDMEGFVNELNAMGMMEGNVPYKLQAQLVSGELIHGVCTSQWDGHE